MKKLFKRQGYHLLGYVGIGALLYAATVAWPAGQRPVWGWSTEAWVLCSWVLAGVFHAWVLLFWRIELHFGAVSAWLGRAGFLVFRAGFILFGGGRLLAVIPISLSAAGTLALPRPVSVALIVATTPAILWGIYSLVFHFGVTRAFGADHFDPAYRGGSLVTGGIFRYVPNAMYAVVLLLLYHPGLLWQSRLGLIAAACHHALVWFHYFCTEKPDMEEIYGRR